ncbi:MAG: hypothetical protein RL748_3673 [Pseudomonadota bacterium]|jgi:DNA transformation protein
MNDIHHLKNLGPKSALMLQHAGITSLSQLKALGAISAFLRVQDAGLKPSLNLLYALEGALQGEHWQVVAKNMRAQLLIELDAAIESRKTVN